MSASHQADVMVGWGGVVGWWGRLGVIIESNLNRVRLSCCWVGVGLGCDKKDKRMAQLEAPTHLYTPSVGLHHKIKSYFVSYLSVKQTKSMS